MFKDQGLPSQLMPEELPPIMTVEVGEGYGFCGKVSFPLQKQKTDSFAGLYSCALICFASLAPSLPLSDELTLN